MSIKKELAEATISYLKSLSDIIISKYGSLPTRWQQGEWMVRTGPSSQVSKTHKRKIIDKLEVEITHADLTDEDIPSRKRLEDLLVSMGIPENETWGGFFNPLIRNWIITENPLDFRNVSVSKVIDEFVDSVVDKTTFMQCKAVIDGFHMTHNYLELDKTVSIRPINEEELWDLSDKQMLIKPVSIRHLCCVSEDLNVLEIKLKHKIGESVSPQIEYRRQAALAGLLLLNIGPFLTEDFIQETNYGIPYHDRILGFNNIRRGSSTFAVTKEIADHFQVFWSQLLAITNSAKHDLKLPLLRLIDSACRDRLEDAIIDCAIGLEAILNNGIQDELTYRFALRGATILNWESGIKKSTFESLQEFYKVRSQVVHGTHVDNERLTHASNTGYDGLRQILSWFISQNINKLKPAVAEVDDKILS